MLDNVILHYSVVYEDGSVICKLFEILMVFGLVVYDVARCIKVTDDGLLQVLHKCSSLQTLNLYALSGYVRSIVPFVSGYIDNLAVLSSGTYIAIRAASQTKLTRRYLFCLT